MAEIPPIEVPVIIKLRAEELDEIKTFSLENPLDGEPDQSPEEANLREAGVDATEFCGNCVFWVPPESLVEGEFINGTCVIVTGTIEYDDVCDFYERRPTLADVERESEGGFQTLDDLDLVPTEAMAEEATRGLEWRDELNRGGTRVGIARARDIKNRKRLSPDTVIRMNSFFARHEVDKDAQGFRPGEDGYPSNGRIAWALWGGDPGQSWARVRSEQIKRIREASTDDVIPDGEAADGLPLDQNRVAPAGDPIDVGLAGPTEEELAVAEETPTGEEQQVEAEAIDVAVFDIVEDSEECAEESEGERTVALTDPESGEVISCHSTVEEAEEAMEALLAESEESDEEEASHHDDEEENSTEEDSVEVTPEQWAAVLEFMDGIAAELEGLTADTDEDDFTAIRSHGTATSDQPWDGPANERDVRSPADEAYFAQIYAWRDDEADTEVKAAYRFIHHFVSSDGDPGAASTIACVTGIGVLNGARGGTTIPAGDREGVYNHLAAHLRDADIEPPELLSTEDAALVAAAVQEGVEMNPADADFISGLIEIWHAENPAEAAVDDDATEEAAATEEFGALPSHGTATVDPPTFTGWNGDEVKKRTREGEDVSYYARIYAWRDEDRDPGSKSAYKFAHHEVDAQGNPGAAVMWATHSAIAVIDDSTIPSSDYQGVYNHLARHLRDGGIVVPDLGDAKPIEREAVEAAIAEMRESWFARVAEIATEAVEKRDVSELGDAELISEIVHRWVEHSQGSLSPAEKEELEVELGIADAEEPQTPTEEFAEEAGGLNGDPDESIGPEGDPTEVDDITVEGDFAKDDFEWEGVLIVEGLPSGDGRQIEKGALTWRELPLPLMLQTVNAEGHDGSMIAGSIHEIERVDQEIVGRGFFDSGDAGQEAKRLISEGTMRGVSADIDKVKIEFQDPEGGEVDPLDAMLGGAEALQVLIEGRIMGATLTPFPAFQEAQVRVIDAGDAAENDVLVAAGYEAGDVWQVTSPCKIALAGERVEHIDMEALVASAATAIEIPVHPPLEWFELQDMEEPEEFQVFADGRCYGLIARWGTCHIGFSDRCVDVPRSTNKFAAFHKPGVLTAEGEQVLCGPIYMDTVHPNLRLVASDAEAHYADTGCAIADVHLYENEWGIVAAGAVRSTASPEQVQALRGSDVSPDWRKVGRNLEVVGLLAVNVSGFIVEGSLVASAGSTAPQGIFDSVSGELQSLVAAGMVHKRTSKVHTLAEELSEVREEIAELREALRPIRAERAAKRLLASVLAVDEDVDNVEVESEEAGTEDAEELAVGEAACSCS